MPYARSIRSVQRAAQVLSVFSRERPELGITELSGVVGLPKSVVFQIAYTLQEAGFLYQDPVTRRFRVGARAFQLGSAFMADSILVQEGQAVLSALASETCHSAFLGVRDGRRAVFLIAIEVQQPIRIAAVVGGRAELHASALGKALVAQMTEAELATCLGDAPLAARTPRTIIDRAVLAEELARVRETGIAMSREENTLGIDAVAAPVFDSTGKVVAAISVAYPAYTVLSEEERRIAERTAAAAARLSQLLGHSTAPAALSATAGARMPAPAGRG